MSNPIASKIWRPRSPKGLEPEGSSGPAGGGGAGAPDPGGDVVVVVAGAVTAVAWGVVIDGRDC